MATVVLVPSRLWTVANSGARHLLSSGVRRLFDFSAEQIAISPLDAAVNSFASNKPSDSKRSKPVLQISVATLVQRLIKFWLLSRNCSMLVAVDSRLRSLYSWRQAILGHQQYVLETRHLGLQCLRNAADQL